MGRHYPAIPHKSGRTRNFAHYLAYQEGFDVVVSRSTTTAGRETVGSTSTSRVSHRSERTLSHVPRQLDQQHRDTRVLLPRVPVRVPQPGRLGGGGNHRDRRRDDQHGGLGQRPRPQRHRQGAGRAAVRPWAPRTAQLHRSRQYPGVRYEHRVPRRDHTRLLLPPRHVGQRKLATLPPRRHLGRLRREGAHGQAGSPVQLRAPYRRAHPPVEDRAGHDDGALDAPDVDVLLHAGRRGRRPNRRRSLRPHVRRLHRGVPQGGVAHTSVPVHSREVFVELGDAMQRWSDCFNT